MGGQSCRFESSMVAEVFEAAAVAPGRSVDQGHYMDTYRLREGTVRRSVSYGPFWHHTQYYIVR